METALVLALSNTASATVLAAVVALVAWRVRRPALLHVLWLVVLLRLLAPPLVGLPLLPAAGGVVTVQGSLALAPAAGRGTPPVSPPHRAGAIARSVAAVWAAGSAIVGLVLAVRVGRFRRLLRAARPAPADLVERVRRVAGTIGCAADPRVVLVETAMSPQVWCGLGRPVLVLPATLVGTLNERQLDTMVGHELAHLKRGDHRVRWMEVLAVALYWWCPTMWWACRRLHQAEEECCDAVVAGVWPDRVRDYASGLVETLRHLSTGEPWRFVAASRLARTASLERRIVSMFNPTPNRPLSTPVRLLVAAAVVVAIGLTPLLSARPAATGSPAPGPAPELSGEPISLHLQDAELRDVLSLFAALSGVEILCEPSVEGMVSADLDNTPWDQALYQVLRDNGLTSVREGNRVIVRAAGQTPRSGSPVVDGSLGEETVFRYVADGSMTEPVKIGGPAPVYPEAARAAGVAGVVVLECVIGADGAVRMVDVLRGLPEGLTEAAVDAVRLWTFTPATVDGEPVAVRFVLTVRFLLDQAGEE